MLYWDYRPSRYRRSRRRPAHGSRPPPLACTLVVDTHPPPPSTSEQDPLAPGRSAEKKHRQCFGSPSRCPEWLYPAVRCTRMHDIPGQHQPFRDPSRSIAPIPISSHLALLFSSRRWHFRPSSTHFVAHLSPTRDTTLAPSEIQSLPRENR